MKQTQIGVTLIELMIAVAIIGILAAVALPSYQDSMRKSRRADVKAVLLGLSNAMERRFTETNSYCDASSSGTTVTGCGTSTGDTGTPSIYTIPASTASFYTVTISGASSSTYSLAAVPTGAQSNDKCGTLSIDNTGSKTVSGATLDASTCWSR
jgi:type IV pilus assembly protein PilE